MALLQSKTILIADDDQMSRKLAEFVLKKDGYNVLSVESGEACIDYLKNRGGVDLVLLDIEMPGLNGMEAARLIRSKDEGVILVFITNIAQYAIKGYEVGALDFILKPLRYSAFEMKLGHIVSQIERKKGKSCLISSGKKHLPMRSSGEV